jgi:hypothetical protein
LTENKMLTTTDIAFLERMQREYDSLLERWDQASAYSQEVANLNATFKASEAELGRAVVGGLFKRMLTHVSGVPGTGDGAERRVEAVIEKKRAERLAEQDARNAGVRATVEDDAARYRWLRERVELDGDTYWHFPTIDRWDYQPGPQLNRQFPSVDVAIDAARGVDAPVTLSGRPAGEADEYHTANQCVDAAVLHLLGTREWPEGWQALRDHFLSLIRSARGVPPSDVRGLDGTQP